MKKEKTISNVYRIISEKGFRTSNFSRSMGGTERKIKGQIVKSKSKGERGKK